MFNFIKALLAIVLTVVNINTALAQPQTKLFIEAQFAGGNFWALQPAFDTIPGVFRTEVGYTGGFIDQPTSLQVSTGTTGHVETVQVIYDPAVVSYETLLNVFWQNIDPINGNGQFCDIGPQYTSVIFYINGIQHEAAERSKHVISQAMGFNQPIATRILASKQFFPAEDYQQKFYLKDPLKYQRYRTDCGRDQRLHQIWDNAPAQLFQRPLSQLTSPLLRRSANL